MKNTTTQTEIRNDNYKVVDMNIQEIVYTAATKEKAAAYVESLDDDKAYAIFLDEDGEVSLVRAKIPVCRISVYEESVYAESEPNQSKSPSH